MTFSAPHISGQAPRSRRERGSVVIVALLISIIIALSLGSYISLGRSTLEIANRAYYNNVAMNLAETGLENGQFAFNQHKLDAADAWDGWTTPESGDAARVWDDFVYEGNNKGKVRVYVDNYNSSSPALIARSTMTLYRGAPVEKWIRVTLTKRSRFDLGMVAKTITMSGGNVVLDSYDSRKGDYNAPTADGVNRNDGITVGSTSLEDDTFNLSNSSVYGYVSVGTPDYDGLKLGPNASIGPLGATGIDYTRVNRDFRMDFDDEVAPSADGLPPVSSIKNTTYYGSDAGTPGGTYDRKDTLNGKTNVRYLAAGNIDLSGGKSLTIGRDSSGNISPVNLVIIITATSGDGIKVTGNSSTMIKVEEGSSLQVYTAANVSIAGGGIANANEPSHFMLFGTKPQPGENESASQSISISGNGNLSAVVYAPGANVTLNGGGSSGHVYGAVVGHTAKLTGGSNFHYDESLKDLDMGDTYRLHTWQELTTDAQRSTVRAKVEF